jgi:hypothetical protein
VRSSNANTKVGLSTTVRFRPEQETITVDGVDDNSLEFAIEFQRHTSVELHAIDMDYSFNAPLKDLSTVSEFKRAIRS